MPKRRPSVPLSERDYVMARAAAARVAAADALTAIDEALAFYANPDEDSSGKKRKQCLTTALDALGDASRGIESAIDVADDVDPTEGEPWQDEEDDDEGDEEEDEDDDEGEDDEEEDED